MKQQAGFYNAQADDLSVMGVKLSWVLQQPVFPGT